METLLPTCSCALSQLLVHSTVSHKIRGTQPNIGVFRCCTIFECTDLLLSRYMQKYLRLNASLVQLLELLLLLCSGGSASSQLLLKPAHKLLN